MDKGNKDGRKARWIKATNEIKPESQTKQPFTRSFTFPLLRPQSSQKYGRDLRGCGCSRPLSRPSLISYKTSFVLCQTRRTASSPLWSPLLGSTPTSTTLTLGVSGEYHILESWLALRVTYLYYVENEGSSLILGSRASCLCRKRGIWENRCFGRVEDEGRGRVGVLVV